MQAALASTFDTLLTEKIAELLENREAQPNSFSNRPDGASWATEEAIARDLLVPPTHAPSAAETLDALIARGITSAERRTAIEEAICAHKNPLPILDEINQVLTVLSAREALLAHAQERMLAVDQPWADVLDKLAKTSTPDGATLFRERVEMIFEDLQYFEAPSVTELTAELIQDIRTQTNSLSDENAELIREYAGSSAAVPEASRLPIQGVLDTLTKQGMLSAEEHQGLKKEILSCSPDVVWPHMLKLKWLGDEHQRRTDTIARLSAIADTLGLVIPAEFSAQIDRVADSKSEFDSTISSFEQYDIDYARWLQSEVAKRWIPENELHEAQQALRTSRNDVPARALRRECEALCAIDDEQLRRDIERSIEGLGKSENSSDQDNAGYLTLRLQKVVAEIAKVDHSGPCSSATRIALGPLADELMKIARSAEVSTKQR
jgi:hypothetical protein